MPKKLVAVIVTIVFGICAILLVNYYIKEREKKLVIEADFRPVLVAVREIPKGTIVRADMVELREAPVKYIQPGALISTREAVGWMTVASIMEKEQIVRTKLASPEKGLEEVGLSMRIPPGKRAVTIKVDPISAAGGLIRPGDYVDIMGTFTVKGEPVTGVIFQNALVLAVDGEMRAWKVEPGRVSTVTLAMEPNKVGLIAMAVEKGKIHLIPRARAEEEVELLPVIDVDTLLGRFQPPPEVAPLKEKPTVEVFRGLKREVVTLPLEEEVTGGEGDE